MIKRLLLFLGILMFVVLVTLILLLITNNGTLISEGFPLQQQWITKLDGHVETLSTNGDQIIFARTSRTLYALHTESGNILWSYDLAWQGIPQPPLTSNGIVYLADGETILALDQENGSVAWKQPAPLTIANVRSVSENIITVEIEPYIYILDVTDGSTLWSKADCSYGGIQTYIDNANIYIPCLDRIRAVDKLSGNKKWEIEKPLSIATVAYQDGTMFYSPDRNTISAFNLRDRKTLWKTTFTGEGFRKFEVLGSYLSVTGSEQFCIFNRETGDQLWCSEFNSPQNPTLMKDKFFIFNGHQNKITAFDIVTGNRLGELSIKSLKIFTAERELMVSNEDILVFGNGSSVFAFSE